MRRDTSDAVTAAFDVVDACEATLPPAGDRVTSLSVDRSAPEQPAAEPTA